MTAQTQPSLRVVVECARTALLFGTEARRDGNATGVDIARVLLRSVLRQYSAEEIVHGIALARPGPLPRELANVALDLCRVFPAARWINLTNLPPKGHA
jgi:hypothetical protein